MREMLARYWNGHEPLWKTFWVILIFGSILYLAITLLIVFLIKSLFTHPQIVSLSSTGTTFTFVMARQYCWPFLLGGIIFLPYIFFATRCGWIATSTTESRFWRDVSRFLVTCYFIIICYRIAELFIFYFGFSATEPELEFFLQKQPLQEIVFVFHDSKEVPSSLANSSAVTAIVQKTLSILYNYNYQNYREKFQQANQYFSSNGWERYVHFLSSTDNPDLFGIISHKAQVTILSSTTPVIVNETNFAGHHFWMVYEKIVVRYSAMVINSPAQPVVKNVNASALVSQSNNSKDIVIDGLMVF